MKVQARLNNFRRSAQKVRTSGYIIKGLPVKEAEYRLENSSKGDALILKKLLLSAVANAQNNYNLEKQNLFVSNVIVEEGKTLKRWRPRAYGRAAQILKRTSNVLIVLEEIERSKKKAVSGKEKKEKKDASKARDEKPLKNQKDQQLKEEAAEEGKEESSEKNLSKFPEKEFSKAKPGVSPTAKKVYRRKSF